MKNINIFVYGSLREGFFNYDKYLSGKISKKMNAKLNNVELYHMPYKGYPAIINGQDSILGEIMVINEADYDSTLEAMDAMEGFLGEGNPENEYHKMIFEVENLESNEIESCYVYFYNKDKDELFDYKAVYLPNGDWKEHMLSNYLVYKGALPRHLFYYYLVASSFNIIETLYSSTLLRVTSFDVGVYQYLPTKKSFHSLLTKIYP